MRPIRFRVWDLREKAFVVPLDFCITGMGQLLLTESNTLVGFGEFKGAVENDRYIISQLTGTSDRTGREIYEGDIAKITQQDKLLGEYTELGIMEFHNGGFRFIVEGGQLSDGVSAQVEVVGNIYANPELLNR